MNVSESCSQELEKTNCIKLTQEPENTPAQKNTQWDTSSHGLASPEPRPQHHWSNVGWSWQRKPRSKKIFECSSRSLQNYFWRILREMRRKLRSKDGHNKYSSRFKLVQSQFVLNCFLVHLKMFKKIIKKLKTLKFLVKPKEMMWLMTSAHYCKSGPAHSKNYCE